MAYCLRIFPTQNFLKIQKSTSHFQATQPCDSPAHRREAGAFFCLFTFYHRRPILIHVCWLSIFFAKNNKRIFTKKANRHRTKQCLGTSLGAVVGGFRSRRIFTPVLHSLFPSFFFATVRSLFPSSLYPFKPPRAAKGYFFDPLPPEVVTLGKVVRGLLEIVRGPGSCFLCR